MTGGTSVGGQVLRELRLVTSAASLGFVFHVSSLVYVWLCGGDICASVSGMKSVTQPRP